MRRLGNVCQRGFALVVILSLLMLLALTTGTVMLRQSAGQRAVARGVARAALRHQAMGHLSQVLERVRQGESPSQAAAWARETQGLDCRFVGGRFLLDCGGTDLLLARLDSRAYNHVLFGISLDLQGREGAFKPEDPHAPALGRPPGPEPGFLELWREKALNGGILLAARPEDCHFNPGGGIWQRTSLAGNPSFLYLGGGLGEERGWVPGVHCWTLLGSTWTCTTGEELLWTKGSWVLRRGGSLSGPLLVEGAPLRIEKDLRLDGELVVWGGGLEIQRGTLEVHPGASSALAIAVLHGGPLVAELPSWNQDRVLRNGDLILSTGSARLVVGDPLRPEQTGALVLAQGRLVRVGGGLSLVGVAAATRVEMRGVPAQGLVWSGRVARMPLEGLAGGDVDMQVGRVDSPGS
jgi:hypothetical protein